MPKITVPKNLAVNAGVAADAARTDVILQIAQGCAAVRYSFGATYTAADSQYLAPGDVLALQSPAAQSAISFLGLEKRSVVDATYL